ncbi:hypothetical protein HPB48_010304 [Haemaphysalis longicornis]|uniref:Uncharacterized protein n=1 Tax=Haemaphysalis longicornis TaxID=44386 RepID=A0A9J6FJX6_HAELO|nr:hypothetical protein HPB48_010304 [Haemaphysalis longicornis]
MALQAAVHACPNERRWQPVVMAAEDEAPRARELWLSATQQAGCCSEATRHTWWKLIRQRYSGPARHHHNLDHLEQMAALVAEYAEHLGNPTAVTLALFFQ